MGSFNFKNTLVAVHGGAGAIKPESVTPEMQAEYKDALSAALKAGYQALKAGGSAVDAVESAVRVLEDAPCFNAGRGAVYTVDGNVELDASIMDGRGRKSGAVACVQRIKNPVTTARKVMESSAHVLLVGDGAEAFARQSGLELVSPEYFKTERQQKKHEEALLVHPTGPVRQAKLGTVGAVAIDFEGNLAAATSTGGTVNKHHGRVGDSPIVGAGVYAENDVCAISCTGSGEHFIRTVAAHEVAALIKYRGLSLEQAVADVLFKQLPAMEGDGGIISMGRGGECVLAFNTDGMFRGCINRDGELHVGMFG